MKNFSYFLIFPFLIISLNCAGVRIIKPKPAGENKWEKCPSCKGYGTVTGSVSKKSRDTVPDDSGSEYIFCLLPLAVAGILADDNFRNRSDRNENFPEYDFDGIERSQENMENRIPSVSSEGKIFKCPRCKGKGWLPVEVNSSPILEKNLEIREKDGVIEYSEKE